MSPVAIVETKKIAIDKSTVIIYPHGGEKTSNNKLQQFHRYVDRIK